MSRYNGGGGNDSDSNPNTLPWKLGQDGRKYPYNPAEPEYLSKYPIGFRGCFKCDSIGHNMKEDCPMGTIKDRRLLGIFFEEFRIHKPNHEKRGSRPMS